MTRNEYNAKVRREVEELKKFRNDNSAFLIWFLINIYCLSEQDSIDAICDGPNDKGIDAIWFDETDEKICIFQSEFSQTDDKNAGDTKIREFAGIFNWFSNADTVQNLRNSSINEELKSKIENLELVEKIANGCKVSFIYVTNKIFDSNAKEFLSQLKIEAYDNNKILQYYSFSSAPEIKENPISLSVTNDTIINYDDKAIVLSIPALELIKLEGIQDQSLFSRNVRLYTGNTRVNKDLVQTLKVTKEHESFFLYHNGLSIICSKYTYKDKTLNISGYQVINGCQSLMTLFQHKELLTDKIQILCKIIKIDNPDSDFVKKITKNSNNQNAISLKDLRSNDKIQINLQSSFKEFYGDSIFYNIKKGEIASGGQEYIKIDFAGQLIKAFKFEESYKTHLKTSFFGEEYGTIFSKAITCHYIYMSYLVYKVIEDNSSLIENEAVRVYGLAKFSLLTIMEIILKNDTKGKEILEKPEQFLTNELREKFIKAITLLFKLVVLDFNAFINEKSENNSFFDYKNLFKNKEFCTSMYTQILTDHKKSIIRHSDDSFEVIYNNA
ncbi:AIPR protein [Treponema sp. JC4]|uniref:AIPR family protein n=1 Tax=Treponema sp. JC4 TaxID=1124982 RepID=UPI00025B02EC|nr:AIPR family protein [Treponema sp. JC4]EID85070.1 AIPR protein [Treponema sp. JC4]